MHWLELKQRNAHVLAARLRELGQDASRETETRETMIDRIILASNAAGHPIEGVPAEMLTRLGLAAAVGSRNPEALPGEAQAAQEYDQAGNPIEQENEVIRRAVITVHPSSNGLNYVPLSVNGRAIQIMCEKKVAIPWPHYMVLENAIEGIPPVQDGTVPAGTLEFQPRRRFNWSFHGEVWTDKNGKVVQHVEPPVNNVA